MGKDKSHKKEKRSKDKHKKHKKSKHRHRSSSASDSSDEERFTINKQLQMGREAARATREVLAHNHVLRKDLRELVRQLDSGGALDISGIPDDFLRSRLLTLFSNLVQLRKNSAGQFFKRQGAASSVLSFVAPILEEGEEQLAPYRAASQHHAAAAADAVLREQQQQQQAPQQPQQMQEGDEGQEPQQGRGTGGPGAAAAGAGTGAQQGPAMPPQGAAQAAQQQQQVEGVVSDSDEGSAGQGGGRPPIGPAMPPPGVLPAAAAAEAVEGGTFAVDQQEGLVEHAADDDEEDALASVRRAGPAMPPAEWLAAAAQMEYPVSEEEEGLEGRQGLHDTGVGVDDDGGDFMVGPPPPEMAEELDLASMDERTAEVSRVLRVLHLHEAEHAKSSAAEKADRPVDPYEVLGLGEQTELAAGEVKKRYWRLSLLIHPDKCDHPRAHDAFQAVTAAAKELQDSELRSKVDARRQEAELRREFVAQAAVAERARQWRMARGEATAEDLAGPARGLEALERDTWMTELPPERRADVAAAPPTGPFTGFSIKGIKSRGDTTGWTMTPQQRAAQLENGSAGGGPLLLTTAAGGADCGVAAANPAQAARMAAAVDAFNSHTRKKSLVELHAERRAGGGKQQKRKKGKDGEGKGHPGGGDKAGKKQKAGPAAAPDLGYDATQHPWRPFNRETDLGPGLDAKSNAAQLLKGERALGSKFGGGQGGGRTFL
ncbi:DnaJ subfamily C member 14 [Chlorella vulgaris]